MDDDAAVNKASAAPRSRTELEAESRMLREALAESEAFSASLAHEVRSPLGAIAILSSLLAKDFAGQLNADGREIIERLNDCSRQTVVLMDRLTGYGRAGQQELQRVPLDMQAEVQSAFREQLGQLGHSGSAPQPRLVVGELPPVFADRELMHALLSSLLSNAIKCTAGRPEPRIEVSGEADEHEARFTIHDNGIGFEPAMAARLFTPFGRVHSQAELAGSGLGLALVRRIARRHGGRAWAEASPGAGATLHVALPKQARQTEPAELEAE